MPGQNPVIYSYPVQRPGFITQANWIGAADDLSLELSYYDIGGVQRVVALYTRNPDYAGDFLLPTSTDVATLGPRTRDILAAHVRMACMINGQAIPGSQEFLSAVLEQFLDMNFQTAIGTVKVTKVTPIDDVSVDIEFQKGSGTKRTYRFDHSELNTYAFAPSTQLLVVCGAIEKQFPGVIHDYPSVIVSDANKDAIAAYCLGLAPWM